MMGISRTCLFSGINRALLTLWIGGLWISGYLVAPTLFSMLEDRQLAGQLAGQIFQSMNYIGLIVGGYLLIVTIFKSGNRFTKEWQVWALSVMLFLIIIAIFVVQPAMQDLKAQGITEGSYQATQFGRLHGLSSVMFLVNSLVGLALVSVGLDNRQWKSNT